MQILISSVAFLALVCGINGHLLSGNHLKRLNFLGRGTVHGITTVRTAYGGNLGMESAVESIGKHGLYIREVTNGRQVVKLAYSEEGVLLTCELLKDDPEAILQFLKHFLSRDSIHLSDLKEETVISHLAKQGNFSWIKLGDGEPEVSQLLDMKEMTSQCKEFHRAEQQNANAKAMNERSDIEDVKVVSRQRRDGELIYPGTRWCGKGSATQDYVELGENRDTDACCRTHDLCPYFIEGMTSKYGYYNFRFTTVSHCNCDEAFRTCLKYRNNPVADNLGEIFFNRLGMKCFVFKIKKVCVKRNFWRKCVEYENQYQAEIRDPLEY